MLVNTDDHGYSASRFHRKEASAALTAAGVTHINTTWHNDGDPSFGVIDDDGEPLCRVFCPDWSGEGFVVAVVDSEWSGARNGVLFWSVDDVVDHVLRLLSRPTLSESITNGCEVYFD